MFDKPPGGRKGTRSRQHIAWWLVTSFMDHFFIGKGSLVLQIPCDLVRRCLGTQNPLQNCLQKGLLEHKGVNRSSKRISFSKRGLACRLPGEHDIFTWYGSVNIPDSSDP